MAYVISTNVRRRHMTSKQKQEALAKLFKLKPKLSARQAAKMVGASPTTASETRKKLVEQGDVSKLDTSVDTKGRRQPRAKKSTKSRKPAAAAHRERHGGPPPLYALDCEAADHRTESGSGESTSSADKVALRTFTNFVVHTIPVDAPKVAKSLHGEWSPEWIIDKVGLIRKWLDQLEAALTKEVAS